MVKRSKTNRKGGDLTNMFNSALGSITSTANSVAKKASNGVSSMSSLYPSSMSSSPSSAPASPTSVPASPTSVPASPTSAPSTQYDSNTSGGMRKRKKGGYTANTSLTNIASSAAPVNGIPTAKAQVWVGGRKRKTKRKCTKRHKHVKSCKTRKSKRRM